jgi:putative redox protein
MAIQARSLENFQVEINVNENDHQLRADEPISVGGDNTGPSPYDMLLSSLAACKIITTQMYARRKDWSLDGVEVQMSTKKVHAKDCEEAVSNPNARIDVIDTEIRFLGNLDDEQIERLKEISERCPVHRTLTSETIIRTKMLN